MTLDEFVALPVISEVIQFLTSIGFSQSTIFSRWAVIQFAILIGALCLAKVIEAKVDEPITNRLRKVIWFCK